MPKTLFQATAHLQEGMQVLAKSRNFEIMIDEPYDQGGKDTGMNPVEVMLAALGACQAIVARHYAQQIEIEFDNFWVELVGQLDTDGFLNKSNVNPGYSDIRYRVHIETDAPRDRVEEFIAFIEKVCPVTNTIANPVNIELYDIIIEEKEELIGV